MIGLIIGSGYPGFKVQSEGSEAIETPYGPPSSDIHRFKFASTLTLALLRHGQHQSISPDQVNYRANVWALRDQGARCIIALNVVGAIAPGFSPGDIALPDQIVDYTWGREASFGPVEGRIPHVDFTEPFDAQLRGHLAQAAADLGLPIRRGIYGVTQGPRLETAAEIDRLERDGCAMVGMTAMPEAVLARELKMPYAICAAAVNYAAGRSPDGKPIHAELEASLAIGMQRTRDVLEQAVPAIFAATM